ncbi:MAG: transcriptional repressor [Armatimonadetes bacterium]|nr:transcriptional repressor [Armatimonadota bacterium]
MSDFAGDAEERLRQHDYRLTSARRQVIAVLAGSDRALSPYGILEAIAGSGTPPDVVTVYRVLDLLESLHLVHRVHSMNGYVACTRLSADGCHHPLICTRCGRIAEVRGEAFAHAVERMSADGWEVTGHVLELSGLCPACREAEQT